jgi:hypothetical protein
MSSISLSLKMMIAASACAGLTLLACGDETSSGGDDDSSDEDKETGKKDAGKRDAGKDAGKKDAGITIPRAVEGEECDTSSPLGALGGQCDADACDEPPCYAQCEGDVYGECKSMADLIGQLRDSGIGDALKDAASNILGDSGYTLNKDGGVDVMFGDAKVTVPAMACPPDYECTNPGAILGLPTPAVCTQGGLPSPCETAADCTAAGFKAATCAMVPIVMTMGCTSLCTP